MNNWYTFLKASRAFRSKITKGVESDKFTIGWLALPLNLKTLYNNLIKEGKYQYNYLSLTSYPKQVFQARWLLSDEIQIHIRIYEDGRVTAHYEFTPEFRFKDHCKGIGCRPLKKPETIKFVFECVNVFWVIK